MSCGKNDTPCRKMATASRACLTKGFPTYGAHKNGGKGVSHLRDWRKRDLLLFDNLLEVVIRAKGRQFFRLRR